MSKKIILACMAIAAFAAFVVGPATAVAANKPVITHPTGTALATGTKIIGTNVGNTIMERTDGTDLYLCSSALLTGTLKTNSAGTIKGEITTADFSGTGTSGDCTATSAIPFQLPAKPTPMKLPWCLESNPLMAEDEFQIKPCAGGKITFVMDVTGLGECKYEATKEALVGTFETDVTTQDAVGRLNTNNTQNGFTLESGSAFGCESSSQLQMAFTLETDEEVVKPLYISKLA